MVHYKTNFGVNIQYDKNDKWIMVHQIWFWDRMSRNHICHSDVSGIISVLLLVDFSLLFQLLALFFLLLSIRQVYSKSPAVLILRKTRYIYPDAVSFSIWYLVHTGANGTCINSLVFSVWMYSLTKAKQSLHHQNEQCAKVRSENVALEEEINQLEESHK